MRRHKYQGQEKKSRIVKKGKYSKLHAKKKRVEQVGYNFRIKCTVLV